MVKQTGHASAALLLTAAYQLTGDVAAAAARDITATRPKSQPLAMGRGRG